MDNSKSMTSNIQVAGRRSFLSTPHSPLLTLVFAVLAVLALIGLQRVFDAKLNDFAIRVITLAGIAIILSVSLNLINGITGQFSLGHAGFMAIGAYTAGAFAFFAGPRLVAMLATSPEASPGAIVSGAPAWLGGLILLVALIIAAIGAGLFGWLVGLPSLRLRGDYLAIVTLGFGEIIRVVITNIEEVGGNSGFNGLPLLTNFVWVYVFVIACILSVRNMAASNLGRSMRAVREDEVAAEAAGINTTRIKVIAFVVSAMWAGVAGGLQAMYNQSANPESFNFIKSVEIVVMVVLGGLGSITGAAIAAVLLTLLENVLRSVTGAVVVGFALVGFAAILSFGRHRVELMRDRKVLAWLNWIIWPLLSALALALIWIFGHDWLGRNISALRYVIYALILIVLMILRPQGLLGRSELSWVFWRDPFRRRAAGAVETVPASATFEPNETRESPAEREPANEGIEDGGLL